jgi:hypothetical protein
MQPVISPIEWSVVYPWTPLGHGINSKGQFQQIPFHLAHTNATNYHSRISVFEGSCNELLCVAGMEDSIDFCKFGVAGTVTSWLGYSGTTYYHVYIHGAEGFDSSVSSYGLMPTKSPAVQPNDFCQQATEISSSGATISGATNKATMDTINSAHCGVPIVAAPGVWYKVEGNGQAMMQISICSNVNMAMSIFTGSCDNLLQCVTGKSSTHATCNNPIQDVASSS